MQLKGSSDNAKLSEKLRFETYLYLDELIFKEDKDDDYAKLRLTSTIYI